MKKISKKTMLLSTTAVAALISIPAITISCSTTNGTNSESASLSNVQKVLDGATVSTKLSAKTTLASNAKDTDIT